MSNELPKEDRTLMSFFNAFHAIGCINNLRPHDNLGAAIETVIEEALMRLQVMKLRNCDVGTPEEQIKRFKAFCEKFKGCEGCPVRSLYYTTDCAFKWSQMPYDNKPTATNEKQEGSK